MKILKRRSYALIFFSTILVLQSQAQQIYHEQYRPQIHFSPKEHWINDPNGMVYYKGVYHLFFQYYPDSTVWGPMHWGHATSADLIHWQQQPIALYPDSLGYIFSGSAVIDKNNTSGFGNNGKPPMVALYTNHDPVGEKAGKNNFQNQSIAYSLDEGKTWTKYPSNPVVINPGRRDFRDPKVMWYEPKKKWIMTLAAGDRVMFYSSPDLKKWKKESEFGQHRGAHGGGWECPDLFTLKDGNKKVWVLIVNLNPGAPNGGSGTQYFLGNFDGTAFTAFSQKTRWLDYGPDNYAGITWSNTKDTKIFIGWMSNWLYANLIPSVKWRNAMTIPRELRIKKTGGEMYITSEPVHQLKQVQLSADSVKSRIVSKNFDLEEFAKKLVSLPCRIDLRLKEPEDFSLVISNDLGEKVIIGYDKKMNSYYIDRTASGKTDFQKDFAAKHIAPRLAVTNQIDLSIILDESSAELFADSGLSVMTEIFFPSKPYTKIIIQTGQKVFFEKIEYIKLGNIWP